MQESDDELPVDYEQCLDSRDWGDKCWANLDARSVNKNLRAVYHLEQGN